MNKQFLKPNLLNHGDTLGVFTPSTPGYVANLELFENGLSNLEKLGFRIKLGSVTKTRKTQGYRSASPAERAAELMDLIRDPEVKGVISTIGGYNSASMIPFLDFEDIRQARKVFCGFSDVTSLHLAILKYSQLQTFYGPSVMCWFGDWPYGIEQSNEWFLDAVMHDRIRTREICAPAVWSNHMRRWDNGDWKKIAREWKKNDGWHALKPGICKAPIAAFNLNTLLSAAGTPYWPDLADKILLIEDMQAPMARTERSFNQLKQIGVFKIIKGLVFSKPEETDEAKMSFSLDDLLLEIAGDDLKYPVVSNFDCGHTVPMLTVPQYSEIELDASKPKASLCFK